MCNCHVEYRSFAGAHIVYCPIHEAAPELLEALKDAISYIKHDCEQRGIPFCFERGLNLIKSLAKAEGRDK